MVEGSIKRDFNYLIDEMTFHGNNAANSVITSACPVHPGYIPVGILSYYPGVTFEAGNLFKLMYTKMGTEYIMHKQHGLLQFQ